MKHFGGCHCGAIRFEFEAPERMPVTICNCSICDKSGFQHIFVPHQDLSFKSGQTQLKTYTFGSHTAKHTFCPTCGVKPLYQPRSHPDKFSVNLRCIDVGTLIVSETIEFDGQNWEKNIHSLHEKT
jgi:hypothetical protein